MKKNGTTVGQYFYDGDGGRTAKINYASGVAGNNTCFLAGTKVLMDDGRWTNIEDIKIGDRVASYDEKKMAKTSVKVTEMFDGETAKEYLLVNGNLKVTPNHQFYSQGKWIEIGKMNIGDLLFDDQGNEVTLSSVEKVTTQNSVQVYNIEVEGDHNYFVASTVIPAPVVIPTKVGIHADTSRESPQAGIQQSDVIPAKAGTQESVNDVIPAKAGIQESADVIPAKAGIQLRGILVHNKLSYNPPAVAGVSVTSGVITHYVGSLYETTKGVAVNHIFMGSTKIATISNDQVRYSFQDHLGSANVVTNSSGSLIELIEYKPFGEFSVRNLIGTSNAAWYYFTGKPLDDETGLMYYGARYYSPLLGRFITPDLLVQAPTNPQTLNRYSYCGNNPVNFIDPDGHAFWFIPLIIAAVKGAVVGAVTGAAIAAATGGNITQGIITGAIGGAIFGMAGNFVKAGTSLLGKALIHATAGAISGSLGALATGGDVGQGALIGGLSAGAAKIIGGQFELPGGSSNNAHVKFASDFVKQALIGAAVGGTTSEALGGSFSDGARYGAISAGIGFVANDSIHKGGYLNDFINDTWTFFSEGINSVIGAILNSDFGKGAESIGSKGLAGIQAVIDVKSTLNDSKLTSFEKGVITALQVTAAVSSFRMGAYGAAQGGYMFSIGGPATGAGGAIALGTLYGAGTAVAFRKFAIDPLRNYFRKDD